MAETLSRKDLNDDQKLQLIDYYQSLFDKLQRDTGVHTSGPLMPLGRASQLDKPANNNDDKALFEKTRKAKLKQTPTRKMNLIRILPEIH